MGDLSGGKSLPGFLSTHPLSSERIQNVRGMLKPGDQALARKPEAYLRAVENMVYGEDPRQGFVEGAAFHHPQMRIEFAIPSGWKVDNTPSQVTLVSGDQNGGLILQAEKSTDNPEDFGRKKAAEISSSGGRLLGEDRTTINGLACFEQAYTITPENQAPVRLGRSYIKKGDWIYVFSALSPAESFQKYEPDFRRVVGSFREMTNASLLSRAPKRLALVKANGSDSLRAILKQAGLAEASWPTFAIMNGLDLQAVPPAGRLVKVAK